MPKGGKRVGSGRPPGALNLSTISKAEAREVVRLTVMAHVDAMLAAQIAHAKGLNYLVAREKLTGKFVKLTQEVADKVLSGEEDKYAMLEVWSKDPSVQAFSDLLNRALDKPKEQEQEIRLTGDAELLARLASGRKRSQK